jgi:predicted enzyme related to lactoylglutathione lyase
VTAAGGRIVEAAAPRADRGLFSPVVDSEGNAFYLHAAA